MMLRKGLRMATAESCTGGLLASVLTDVSGSSGYFQGGVVAYSNAVKVAMLGVNEGDLAQFGAVSEPIARQMAEGACAIFAADIAVGVTGIAGPTGGTPEKPVGLVYIAVAHPRGTQIVKNQFSGSREQIKQRTVEKALQMVLESIE